MKALPVILCLLFFSSSVFSQTSIEDEIRSFPSYSSMWDHVMNDMEGDTLGNIALARRPDGWYLTELNQLNETLGEYLLWSLKTKSFVDLNLVKSGFIGEHKAYPTNSGQLVRMFAIHPYWGYKGWDFDVIRHLENEENLSDTLTYGLARSYSNYAQGIIRGQYAFHQNLFPDAKFEKLAPERVELIKKYIDNSLMHSEALAARNPDFVTIVGSAEVKAGHEFMDAWLRFNSIRETEIANTYLRDNLYPSNIIAMARNYLSACDEEAILFTNGDTDTYPLWYVQQKYGIRKDIKVINMSLLNMAWYIDMVKENLFGDGFHTYINDSAFYQNNRSYCLMAQDTGEIKKLGVLLENMKSENGVFMMESNRTILTLANESPLSLSFPSYIFNGQLAMLDFIASSNGLMPICFTSTSSTNSYSFFEGYLRNDGMVYRVVSPREMANNTAKFIDTDILYSYVMNDFDVAGLDKLSGGDPFRMTLNYRYMFANLADELAKKGDEQRFQAVVTRYAELFPEDRYSPQYSELVLARGFLMLEKKEIGSKMLKETLMQLVNELMALRSTAANAPNLEQVMQNVEKKNNLIDYGIQILEQYEQFDAAQRVRDAWDASKH